MITVEELAELSPQQYLQHFQMDVYLQDLVSLLMARRRTDGRSVPQFIGHYFETVLRGQHVVQRDYNFVCKTPLNRRAFVALLRSALRGIPEPGSTAVTARDFHDLVIRLCPSFPLALVEHAATYAEPADEARHRLLGQVEAFGASSSMSPNPNVLKVLLSLQRMVEFCIVYPEVLALVQSHFEAHVSASPSSQSRQQAHATLPSATEAAAVAFRPVAKGSLEIALPSVGLMEYLQRQLRESVVNCSNSTSGSALPACAAMPSERALLRLLRRSSRSVTSSVSRSSLYLGEAVAEMAAHFELEPETNRPGEEGVADFFAQTGASDGPTSDPQRVAAAGTGSSSVSVSTEKRRRSTDKRTAKSSTGK
eukprot:TRINITY_DN76918_c0_g1_i1.p1 TRINITY_DN76918_c0_g1~~TRINITY_DN76918_c0_g1_i1.p1  ORF type:complete len:366 (+),score=51.42 TRINITY_DN76918_c0_g1_i1:66-1163(+)